jgi:spore maturation protein CgeB
MNILYSFNKLGFEEQYWRTEITGASTDAFRFIPFNHGDYIDPQLCIRAQLLDNLYFARHPGLMRLYAAFEAALKEERADAVIVDNCQPYHPDYLRKIPVYKVLRIADGPLIAYDRDFAYLHAFDQVLYHSPAYSPEMGMAEKLQYLGVKNCDFWPQALFDAMFDATKTEEALLEAKRDIDIIFIGALFPGKMPLLAKVKKAFGRRCRIYGLTSVKRNIYFNLKYGFPGWVRSARFEEYVPLYQRAKIGINVHNRGDYTVGSYRLFDLPGNDAMQISDGGEFLESFFRVGEEIVSYNDADELIDKLRYYLDRDEERNRIALNGYRRVMRDHRIRHRLHQTVEFIQRGMERTGWSNRRALAGSAL